MKVASFTDAWIETFTQPIPTTGSFVASFTDAWIETYSATNQGRARQSHLLQMRGLKLIFIESILALIVASFTDAWIETSNEIAGKITVLCRIFYRCVD